MKGPVWSKWILKKKKKGNPDEGISGDWTERLRITRGSWGWGTSRKGWGGRPCWEQEKIWNILHIKETNCRKPLVTLSDEFISSIHLVKTLVTRWKSCSDVLSWAPGSSSEPLNVLSSLTRCVCVCVFEAEFYSMQTSFSASLPKMVINAFIIDLIVYHLLIGFLRLNWLNFSMFTLYLKIRHWLQLVPLQMILIDSDLKQKIFIARACQDGSVTVSVNQLSCGS